jgi:hypothetical protein
MELVAAYFERTKIPCAIEEGRVRVGSPGEENERQLGLMNLAQMCHSRPESEWPAIVQTHFDGLQRAEREGTALEERLKDFAKVSELLAVRIWPEEMVADLRGISIISRQDLEGTLTVLVYDLPTSVRQVTEEDAAAWGKTPRELFDIGLANVRANCIPDHAVQELVDGIQVHLYADESFYVATHVLLLEEHAECIGPHGALVGIPHRHALVAYPIDSIDAVKAVAPMCFVISGMEKEGPGSICPHLYWYRPQGGFVRLPYRLGEEKLEFAPPDEFTAMLAVLAEAEERDKP